jgi:hypothetical protein
MPADTWAVDPLTRFPAESRTLTTTSFNATRLATVWVVGLTLKRNAAPEVTLKVLLSTTNGAPKFAVKRIRVDPLVAVSARSGKSIIELPDGLLATPPTMELIVPATLETDAL